MLFIQLAIITLFSSSAFAIFAGQNDPRIERWNRMKIALPDNLTPEDEVLAPAQVLPSSRRPLYREQYNEPLGYKHLGLPPAIKQVAPLPPSAVKHQAPKSASGQAVPTAKPYHKFAAVDDKSKFMSIAYINAENRYREKQVVGLDGQGNVEYVNVPVHNRV
ncbi:hypothetical protein G6F56_003318 [Rhizopus delemar]|nr:hypothetical protein G6F56_003318 [Rhizopus delemar]